MRSRGVEPFLKELTQTLIHFLLGASKEDPDAAAREIELKIQSGELDVHRLAKSEILSQNPEAYRKKIEAGGKPRRASAEVALMMGEQVRMGERISYFISLKEKGKTADWQRALPVEQYDKEQLPYDPSYYIKKLNDWRKRYAPFYPKLAENPDHGMLFG
jgi:DNA polymerase elongation subunit (family B)